jgi:hypothetical protein
MKIKNLLFVILLILINNIYSQNNTTDYKSAEVYSHEAVLFGKFEV